MTLREFLNLIAANPEYILAFFAMIPLTAILSNVMGKGEGHLSPWKFLYSTLIYLVAVPGIFAITLSIYLFLFERISIFDTDIYTQILPIFSMIITFLIIRKNVDLDHIPGFGKLSGMIMMITVVMMMMWFMEKTRIFVISVVPFQNVIFLFVGLLIVFRFGWSKMMKK